MTDEVRVSDAEREQAVERLRQASADGRLTLEELVARTAAAYTARTGGELVRVTDDLPAVAPDSPGASRGAGRRLVTVLGGLDRRGRWRVGEKTTLVCVLGGARLDFRKAVFESTSATLRIVCVFGGVQLDVPAGLDVEVETASVLGGVEESGERGASDPHGPSLRLTGLNLLGGVQIRYRNPVDRSGRAGDRLQ